jgi:hypothetical protein
MGRRDISQRYIRLTGWVWIAVIACATFAALFASLVPIKTEDYLKPGEILQSIANLIGAAIGTFGAFMVARWSLGQAERDRQEHRSALALLAMNAILDLLEQYVRWSKAFDRLDRTSRSIENFIPIKNEYVRETLKTSPVLRGELISSFPALENALHGIESGDNNFHIFFEQCFRSRRDPSSEVFIASYNSFIDNLLAVANFMSDLAERSDAAMSLRGSSGGFKKDYNDIVVFRDAVRALAKRTALSAKTD